MYNVTIIRLCIVGGKASLLNMVHGSSLNGLCYLVSVDVKVMILE